MEIIIRQDVLQISLFFMWTAGLSDGSEVTQTAPLWEDQGANATMSCSHTKGSGYYQMYWYRQLPGETMKQIVFTSLGMNPDFGDFSREKFSATKPNAESGTFTVKNLQPQDKGLYFCSVSQHSDADALNSLTKTTVNCNIAIMIIAYTVGGPRGPQILRVTL
ncbi:uncharacterized protein ACO6RY_06770 [Pungitius sinensis]